MTTRAGTPSQAEIETWLRQELARVLDVDGDVLAPEVRFNTYGLDSARATALVTKLGVWLGRRLPATLLWQHPTIRQVASHLAHPPAASRPVDQRRRRADEPIAVIGIASRFSSAETAEEFWRLLHDGVDTISEVPKERWSLERFFDADPQAPGKMSTRWGGFLKNVDTFDAKFFGISGREAVEMDPQQRIVLEVAWHALEDAAIVPETLVNSRTSIYMGALWSDYARLSVQNPARIAQHSATGMDLSIIPARVSYALGLQGASMAVNTACSSSLVAVHLACQSLRSGESTLALAGGVNLILSPVSTVAMTKFGAMCPDGRCKAFDARANGYVRGEGAGVLVLKPLSKALADGNPIYCTIIGSDSNNDGFSNGLTAPNPKAQEDVLRGAYARAGVDPATVQYVEAHGTGTMLGDPIEAGALGAVLGVNRPPEKKLRLGSVKTNLGHTEAAAGVAGLTKVALAMKHGELPPSLHFLSPNPHIAFDDLRLDVQSRLGPWPASDGPPLAGVSSFGFGGTNCHVVVRGFPEREPKILPLTAQNTEQLRANALSLLPVVAGAKTPADVAGLCAEAARRANVRGARAAFVFDHVDELPGKLMDLLRGDAAPARQRPRVAFVCSGHGGQWGNVGVSLLRTDPIFRAKIQDCDRIMRELAGWSVLEELTAGQSRPPSEKEEIVQPLFFCLQVALGALWRAWGVQPDVVLGHSRGEIAAAEIAGILSLEDAIKIAHHRSRLVAKKCGAGRMLVVRLGAEETERVIAPESRAVSVAVTNSPTTTVVSGDRDAIERLQQLLVGKGVDCTMMSVEYASHCFHMDDVQQEVTAALQGLAPSRGSVPFRSTITGDITSGKELGASYWGRALRAPVRFQQAVEAELAQGDTVFVELAPQAILCTAIEETAAAKKVAVTALPSCRRDVHERESMLTTLAGLFERGVDVRFDTVIPMGHLARERLPAFLQTPVTASSPPVLLQLSAKSPAALSALCARYDESLATHPERALADVAASAARDRSPHAERVALLVSSVPEAREKLGKAAAGDSGQGIARGRQEPTSPSRVAMLFTGQGAQYAGMGRGLYETEPVFRDALDRCAAVLDEVLPRPLLSVIFPKEGEATPLSETAFTQPALFALEHALFELWRSIGVTPAAVMGHSVGEYAAACVAGVFSLEDGLKLIAERARLMQSLPLGAGGMAAVRAGPDDVLAVLREFPALSLAAENGNETVISGALAPLDACVKALEAKGKAVRRLDVSHAFHSVLLEPMLDGLEKAAAGVRLQAPSTIPLVSNWSGELAGNEVTSPRYWRDHARSPVKFASGIRALAALGIDTFLEIGPSPTLVTLGQGALANAENLDELEWTSSLRKGKDDVATFLESVGRLWVRGIDVDGRALHKPHGRRRVPLPAYPFQRERYWVSGELEAAQPAARAGSGDHPVLGARVPLQNGGVVYEREMSVEAEPLWAGHVIHGHVIVPASGHLELLRAAAQDVWGEGPVAVERVLFMEALVIPPHKSAATQVLLTPSDEGFDVSISSRVEGGPWRHHVTGAIRRVEPAAVRTVDVAAVEARCPRRATQAEVYERFKKIGFAYTGPFQGLDDVHLGDGEAVARLVPRERETFGMHPAVFDCVGQLVLVLWDEDMPFVPFEDEHLVVHDVAATPAYVRAWSTAGGEGAHEVREGGFEVLDDKGNVVVEMQGMRGKRTTPAALRSQAAAATASLFALALEERPRPAKGAPAAGTWWVVGDDEGVGPTASVASALAGAGARVERLALGADPARIDGAALAGVVVVAASSRTPADAEALALRTEALASGLARVTQRLAASSTTAPLFVVTDGVHASAPSPEASAQAALWGLARAVRAEHPALRCALVDATLPAAAADVVAELSAKGGDDEVVLRDGKRLVPRLQPLRAQGESEPALGGGTVVVTGGAGALGLRIARHLAARGVRSLVLSGRRPPSPAAQLQIDSLMADGVDVRFVAADVSVRADAERVLAAVRASAPLVGVVHAAGVNASRPVKDLDEAELARILAPKLRGAALLDELTRDSNLELFVLLSSISSLVPATARSYGAYAAANAFLDGLSRARKAAGRPSLALQLGPVLSDDGGMAGEFSAEQWDWLGEIGVGPLPMAEALRLFSLALGAGKPEALAVALDVAALAKQEKVEPILDALRPQAQAKSAAGKPAAKRPAAYKIARAPEEDRRGLVEALVRGVVAQVLGVNPDEVPQKKAFNMIGMDSLMAVEIRKQLAAQTGLTFSATLAFDQPNVEAMTTFVLKKVNDLPPVDDDGDEAAAAPAPSATQAPRAAAAIPAARPVTPPRPSTPSTPPTPATVPAKPAPAAPAVHVSRGGDGAPEPIAIVGMACRYPGGVVDPESMWRLLAGGVDAIGPIPADRWDASAWYDADDATLGKMCTKEGGFVDGIDGFDADFFGISPREAMNLDPQQRLLLEASWEALERAGVPGDALAGTATGVFVGIMYNHYLERIHGAGRLDGYATMGGVPSAAAGRIAYVLGAVGPTLTVDAACASSLVTTHLACQALRNGECDLALSGGATTMLNPALLVDFTRMKLVAPDGRCKSFDRRADGVGWSEGAGMLVLKRQSDAERDGDPVLALILGSAVTHAGRSQGLAAPSRSSQEAAMRGALKAARTPAAAISYVEGMGTGTPLGDAIEIQAIGAALQDGRKRGERVLVGTIKSNLGHTQAAAGAASLMKTVLALQNERIPKTLHFQEPNPEVPWDELPVQIAAQATSWSGADRRAAVHAFGMTGTNATIILAPGHAKAPPVPVREKNGATHVLPLSAKSAGALTSLAERFAVHLGAHPEQGIDEVCRGAGAGRAHFWERAAVVASSADEMKEKLIDLMAGRVVAGIARGSANDDGAKVAMLFCGEGAQLPGMGRDLARGAPVFRETLERCAAAAAAAGLDVPLLDAMAADGVVDGAKVMQPALAAIEIALAALWKSWGVEPSVVVGHGVGEISAACVAGAMSLDDAMALAVARGRLFASSATGRMLAVRAPVEVVHAAIAREAGVSVAAENGVEQVIAGPAEAVDAVRAALEAEGHYTKAVEAGGALYSPAVEPVLDELERVAATLRLTRPRIKIVSTVDGEVATDAVGTAAHWRRQARAPVHFAAALKRAAALGCSVFVDASPQPVLSSLGAALLSSPDVGWLPSLKRGRDARETLSESLAKAFVRGVDVDWRSFAGEGARPVLPTYPWQRERFWVDGPTAPARAAKGVDGAPGGAATPNDVVAAEAPAPAAASSPAPSSLDALEGIVREAVATVVQRDPSRVDRKRPLRDLGVDSLMWLEVVGIVGGAAKVSLEGVAGLGPDLDVAGIAARVAELTAGDAPAPAPAAPAPAGIDLERVLKDAVAAVVQRDPERIDRRRSLQELGIDSLMWLEVQGIVGGALGRDVPADLFSKNLSLADIVKALGSDPPA